jgi:hypothetical protein
VGLERSPANKKVSLIVFLRESSERNYVMSGQPKDRKQNERPASDAPEPAPAAANEWTQEMIAERRRVLEELAAYDQEIGI